MTLVLKSIFSAKSQGEWAEVCFLLRALTLGLRVSKPFGENCPYDFIVDNGRRLLRVQVKSVLIPQQGFYQIKTAGGNRSKRCYSPRELDLIAACVIPAGAWYIIPLRALRRRKTIRVCPHRPSRRPFEPFREAWHLLTGEIGSLKTLNVTLPCHHDP